MAEIVIDNTILASVEDKAVVITGGAQGIGAATVTQLFHAGAHVFHGDLDVEKGTLLDETLKSSLRPLEQTNGYCSGHASGHGHGSVQFLKVDVRDYESQLALFDAALEKHGRVDMAIYCAGVGDRFGWFGPDALDLKSVREIPTPVANVVDINLTGTLYFVRLALAYLKHTSTTTTKNHHLDNPILSSPVPNGNSPSSSSLSKSITLVSSSAGFKGFPGLFAYSASKHGVLGLMRSLRPHSRSVFGVRINTICPTLTDTRMLNGLKAECERNNIHMNTAEEVARVIVQVATDQKEHGKAVYMAGGRALDVEEGIERLEGEWLGGEEWVEDLRRSQGVIGMAYGWGKKVDQVLSNGNK
ncbi:hypothetical protein VTN00DRAFT_8879 [Thermoascus crustaceus]|uniref:uncharacterized protein n=1 Tax=Thermoascus crustaceus TaxID=5088 RepID=UPI0037444DAA